MSLPAEEAPSIDHKNSLEGKFGKQKLGQKLQKVENHKKLKSKLMQSKMSKLTKSTWANANYFRNEEY